MISSLINKELKSVDSHTNIVMSNLDNQYFHKFLGECLKNCDIFNFDDTIYGCSQPDIVICNNRVTHLIKSIELCKYYHVPLLIVDHEIKSDMISSNAIQNNFGVKPITQIAISQQIYNSWGKIHDYIISIDISTIDKWKNLLYTLCKQNFQIHNGTTTNGQNTN